MAVPDVALHQSPAGVHRDLAAPQNGSSIHSIGTHVSRALVRVAPYHASHYQCQSQFSAFSSLACRIRRHGDDLFFGDVEFQSSLESSPSSSVSSSLSVVGASSVSLVAASESELALTPKTAWGRPHHGSLRFDQTGRPCQSGHVLTRRPLVCVTSRGTRIRFVLGVTLFVRLYSS